jgi:hypothetical protein
MTVSQVLLAVTVAVVLGGGVSCKRGKTVAEPPRPRLGVVEVEDVTLGRPDGAPLSTDEIATAVRKQLLVSGLFDAATGGLAGADGNGNLTNPAKPSQPVTTAAVVRVRVNVGVELAEVGKKGVVRAGVRVKMDSRPSDAPGAIQDELAAGGEQHYEVGASTERARLAQQLAERTVADLFTGFLARAHLRVATPAEIHAAIAGQGAQAGNGGAPPSSATAAFPGLREEAIHMAGVRGLRGEVPLLLQLLQDENEAVRDAALGALIALRERRAVTELTRNRSLRDRHEMRKILDAIAILGGDEARDYLSFVAESHEDEEIRKLASEAKARLDRRQKP